VLDPLQEFRALRGRNARGLMRQIGGDVAIHENNLPLSSAASSLYLVSKRSRHRAWPRSGDRRYRAAEISIEEFADHFAKPGIVLRKAGGIDGVTARLESESQDLDLSALAAAVDAFYGN